MVHVSVRAFVCWLETESTASLSPKVKWNVAENYMVILCRAHVKRFLIKWGVQRKHVHWRIADNNTRKKNETAPQWMLCVDKRISNYK